MIGMPLLQLTDHTIFDPADGVGILLDSTEGVCFELNPIATLILDAALRFDTTEDAVHHLGQRIDATGDMLREGIEALAAQLAENHLIEPHSAEPQ
jgi:hypothetical protein